jgi:hypothetical protein
LETNISKTNKVHINGISKDKSSDLLTGNSRIYNSDKPIDTVNRAGVDSKTLNYPSSVSTDSENHNLVFGNRDPTSNLFALDARVEVSNEGCPVRVDHANKRVIVQNRILTYKNNVVVKKSPCTDSSEFFLIQKNYSCDKCEDIIDIDNKKAYATYELFYNDRDGSKISLSSEPEKDEEISFNIVPEQDCPEYLDIERMQAYPQIRLIYQDRANTKKIVKNCHRSDNARIYPIELTADGCTASHDFENNWTTINKKGIYQLDGQQQIAFPCRPFGSPIKHDYDMDQCPDKINLPDGRISVLGKNMFQLMALRLILVIVSQLVAIIY